MLYQRDLTARMIVEYKAPEIEITQKVFDQITRYNMVLKVDYLIVSNGLQHYCCRIDYEHNSYIFCRIYPVSKTYRRSYQPAPCLSHLIISHHIPCVISRAMMFALSSSHLV